MPSLTPLRQRAATAVRRPGQLLVPRRGLPPAPAAQPRPWDGMTHAQIAEWVEHYRTQHALALPPGWSGWTLQVKRDWLNANVDPTP